MNLPKALLYALAYWVLASMTLGLAVTLYGDCGTDPRPNGLHRCLAKQGLIVLYGLGIAAIGFLFASFLVWRHHRKPR